MSVGIQIGGGDPAAAAWFIENHERLFDDLGIPRCEHGMLYRETAVPMLVVFLQGGRLILDDGREGPLMQWCHFSEKVEPALRAAKYRRPEDVDRLSPLNLKSSECHKRTWEYCVRESRTKSRRLRKL